MNNIHGVQICLLYNTKLLHVMEVICTNTPHKSSNEVLPTTAFLFWGPVKGQVPDVSPSKIM